MSSGITQDDRLLSISTPLGKDVLLLAGLVGSEGLSAPFHFDLDLVADKDRSIQASQLIGQRVTIEIRLFEGALRYINGVVGAFSQGASDQSFNMYRARVVPSLALLAHRIDIRIFQRKSVTDIIEAVLKGAGVTDYALRTSGTYAQLEYCVQYNESDLAFVSRLMEENGIFYFFEHDESKHTLVIADQTSAHQTVPEQETARYEQMAGGTATEDVVTAWMQQQEFRAGKYSLTDYNFEMPNVALGVDEATTMPVGGNGPYDLYAYPGRYAKRSDGTERVRIRMQEEESLAITVKGSSTCRSFVSGYRFTLSEHPQLSFNAEYVLTEVWHSAWSGSFSAHGGGEASRYQNEFTCMPFKTPYRPARKTPRPAVYGVQPAIVVGESGEEIWVDKYGRVKVQFFWDREGKKNEQSSCWVRVAFPWAGKNWGFVALPRIGQEVLIAFENGDPDRPLIVGSVYNAEQMPPYALPDNQTQSGIKSHSSKGGGADNFNELRFEDKKGSEQVYVQAEKDLSTVVKNNETREVRSTRTTTIQSDDTKTIKKGNDVTTLEEGDQSVTLKKGGQTIELDKGDRNIKLHDGGYLVTMDDGDHYTQIKDGNHQVWLTKGNHTVTVENGDQDVNLSMGNQTTKLDLGAVSTEAMQSIELKVGSSSIKIDQMGVTIKGMEVQIEGELLAKVKGLITQVVADGMLQAKGGITMIN
ncbi:MAG TPA: type VI secretion system tip protein TssI/VgrG [Gemmatimonadaceae bacterium]|nr:type VI secretion system tip protein TssI/VgrG [Gemmatimonadaceae bacterium]